MNLYEILIYVTAGVALLLAHSRLEPILRRLGLNIDMIFIENLHQR